MRIALFLSVCTSLYVFVSWCLFFAASLPLLPPPLLCASFLRCRLFSAYFLFFALHFDVSQSRIWVSMSVRKRCVATTNDTACACVRVCACVNRRRASHTHSICSQEMCTHTQHIRKAFASLSAVIVCTEFHNSMNLGSTSQ